MGEGEEDVSCARILLEDKRVVYVRVQWRTQSFTLDVSDGFQAWTISPSPDTVQDRAAQWDQSVDEYLRDLRRCLTNQQTSSVYRLTPAQDNGARLAWTLEKSGTQLESRWRLNEAPDSKAINCQILDFVLEADTKIREELKQKNKLFNGMKAEVEKCLEQNKRLADEKIERENELFTKFVAVLNNKKAKLRELESATTPVKARYGSSKADEEDEDLGEDTDHEQEDSGSSGRKTVSSADMSPGRVIPESQTTTTKRFPTQSQEAGESSARNVDGAAEMMLLSGPNYTSLPRKRRLL